MRITSDEMSAIRDCARAHFGEDAVVRLFGSRLRDDLSGGDIDLHVTAEDGGRELSPGAFLDALSERIGDQPIDLLLVTSSEVPRPIDDIAILTGHVLLAPDDGRSSGKEAQESDEASRERARMTTLAYRRLVADAVTGGRTTMRRLQELLTDLGDKLPLDAETIRSLARADRLATDSLLLQFGNMVAIVQDQLLRGILLARDGRLETRDRSQQRLHAEATGIIPAGFPFEAIARIRNQVAHQYPADPARQASIVNAAAAAVPEAIRTFEALAAYAEMHLLPPDASE